MRLLALALLLIPAHPAEETYTFTATWQRHEMLFDGAPAYSLGTTWTLEIPAPSEKPAYVDFRAMSALAYKFVAHNLGPEVSHIEFRDRSLLTLVTLEGVPLYEGTKWFTDIAGVMEPWGWFWGPDRPKARKRMALRSRAAEDFPEPVGGTWALTITAVSHFAFEGEGPGMFGEVMKQRVKGSVTYQL